MYNAISLPLFSGQTNYITGSLMFDLASCSNICIFCDKLGMGWQDPYSSLSSGSGRYFTWFILVDGSSMSFSSWMLSFPPPQLVLIHLINLKAGIAIRAIPRPSKM